MGHALSLRATSLGASGILLGLAVLAALTASIATPRSEIDSGFSFPVITPAPDPTPPPTREPAPRSGSAPFAPFVAPPFVATIDGPTAQPDLPVAYAEPAPITNPHWLQRPTDLARYYPRRALARGVEGQAILNCLVSTTGALSCSVVSETPFGWEFGEAALRIARDHQMQPASRGGEYLVGRYQMVVPFALN